MASDVERFVRAQRTSVLIVCVSRPGELTALCDRLRHDWWSVKMEDVMGWILDEIDERMPVPEVRNGH